MREGRGMSWVLGLVSWVRQTGVELLGWLLIVAGIAALVLPGPGMLMVVAGLALLSNRYAWARRWIEPIKIKAFDAARYGVATWPRIGLSVLSALCVMTAGVVWWVSPRIPDIGPLDGRLPFAGWGTGLSMIVSSIIALALIVFSIARFRNEEHAEEDSAERELDRELEEQTDAESAGADAGVRSREPR